MQKMNAILEMGDDYDKAISEYHKEKDKREREK
jgi:hypothetical protein